MSLWLSLLPPLVEQVGRKTCRAFRIVSQVDHQKREDTKEMSDCVKDPWSNCSNMFGFTAKRLSDVSRGSSESESQSRVDVETLTLEARPVDQKVYVHWPLQKALSEPEMEMHIVPTLHELCMPGLDYCILVTLFNREKLPLLISKVV